MERRETEDPGYKIQDRRWWTREEPGGEAGADESAAERKPRYVEELEAKLRDKDQKLRETIEQARRVSDEFEKARRRLERESRKAAEQQRRQFLSAFLDVVDDLDRALDAARADGAGSALLQGVELVRQRFLSLLEGHGVSRLDAEGQPFDPARHEAVSTRPVEDAERDRLVLEVIKPGYLVADEVLRPAVVVVGRHDGSTGAAA